MSRQPAVLGILALVSALAPAHAGTIYIPLPPQQTAGTINYRTEVVAANTGAAASPLTTAFLSSGSASGTPAHLTLPPHATFVLTNAAPAGREGMLAVTGGAEVAVTARLVAVGPSGKALGSVLLPAVDPRNAAEAGDTVQIQGVSRPSAAAVVRFGVINLGDGVARCTASGFRSDGASAGGAVDFTLPAQVQSAFLSPLSSFGARLFADARVEVTCDQPFYPYALQLGGAAGETAVHTPSAMLDGLDGETADSVVAAETAQAAGSDGEEPEADSAAQGSGPTVGKDSLTYAGVFLDARRNNSARAFTLPLRQGVRYRKITVDFDLYVNKWQAPLFHAVTALRRNDRTLYNGLLVRADRAKTIIDLGHEQMAKGNGPWKQQTQYHIRMETDAGSRTVTLKLFRGGAMVHTVKGRLVSTDLSVSGGKVISVDFGIGRIADGAYFPPIGWKYSNLNVKAEPF